LEYVRDLEAPPGQSSAARALVSRQSTPSGRDDKNSASAASVTNHQLLQEATALATRLVQELSPEGVRNAAGHNLADHASF
jgi:hypothetical protein